MSESVSKNKKIQINVSRNLASQAEEIMKEVGLNPTVVINALYKEIVAKKKIPLSFSLTGEQIDDFELRQLAKQRPVHEVRTKGILWSIYHGLKSMACSSRLNLVSSPIVLRLLPHVATSYRTIDLRPFS